MERFFWCMEQGGYGVRAAPAAGRFVADVDRAETWANRVFGRLPQTLLRLAGRMIYPHLS